MSYTDTTTSQLVINKLTKQQYEDIQNPSDTELFLVPEDEEHKPICYPTTASEVKTTSMVVKSSVSDNGKILTENGFVYNTSGNPTISDTKVICDLGVGFFEKKLENLTQNTEYHIKSYGQNASGIVYGSELVQRTTYNPIPVEYQLVEYLESSGTQYIDTNVLFIEPLSWEFNNITVYSTGNIQWKALFGVYNISNSSVINYLQYNTSTKLFQFNISGNVFTYTNSADSYLKILAEYNNSECRLFLNDVEAIHGTYICSYNLNNIYLFRLNAPSAQNYNYFIGKCGDIKVYSNYNLIRHFYPVYRKSDNKPGLYDIVNNVFYTNQGTGEFIVGPDKPWTE